MGSGAGPGRLGGRHESISRRDASAQREAGPLLLQVGEGATDTFDHRFGYPIEIVPLANPASLTAGGTLEFLVLAAGEPVPGQLVYASYEGFHGHDDAGAHREAAMVRTNGEGVAQVELTRAGRWYLRLIRMLPSDDEGVDYESNWTTLTFEVP